MPNDGHSASCRAVPAEGPTGRLAGIFDGATQTVFGEGSATAQVVFVGEQPGDMEDRAGSREGRRVAAGTLCDADGPSRVSLARGFAVQRTASNLPGAFGTASAFSVCCQVVAISGAGTLVISVMAFTVIGSP